MSFLARHQLNILTNILQHSPSFQRRRHLPSRHIDLSLPYLHGEVYNPAGPKFVCWQATPEWNDISHHTETERGDYPSCRALYTKIYNDSHLKPIKLWALKDHDQGRKKKWIIQTFWRSRRHQIDHTVSKVDTRHYCLLLDAIFYYALCFHTI